MRMLPFFKPKKGFMVAGGGLETSSGGSGGGSFPPFSSEETDTGMKWIDGKNIYMITVRWEKGDGYAPYNLGTGKTVLPLTCVMETDHNDEVAKSGAWTYYTDGNFRVATSGGAGNYKHATIFYTKNS